jgi:hypothetical protein
MYCRSRPQYRSDLGWILGVAFLGTLTRSARPVRGFTFVRCCSTPRASSPHGLAARAVAVSLRLLPTRSAEDLHLLSRVHAWHTKDKPFGWPRKARPSLTATRHDGAVGLRSGRKNGSAGVKQKNGRESRFRAKILSSRYARATINFPGTKNRNNRGFPHQIPWSCLPTRLRHPLPWQC